MTTKELQEMIMVRISRRSYLETKIAAEAIAALRSKIDELNEQSGLNITLTDEGGAAMAGGKSYGMFNGVRTVLLLKGKRDLLHLRERVGYYGELLILEATKLGLGSCWVGGTFDRAALQVPDDEELICIVPIGNVREENTLKEKFFRGIMHRKSKTVEELIQSDVPLTDKLRAAMELVKRAPTARNMQKATFRQQAGVITAHVPNDYMLDLVDLGKQAGVITAHVPNDYMLDLVDLGICKLHLECGMGGRFELGNGGALVW